MTFVQDVFAPLVLLLKSNTRIFILEFFIRCQSSWCLVCSFLVVHTFYNVYTFEKQLITSKIYAQKLYYSSEKGIVAIFFNNSDVWELQP